MRKWTIRVGHLQYECTNAIQSWAFAGFWHADNMKSVRYSGPPIDNIMQIGIPKS